MHRLKKHLSVEIIEIFIAVMSALILIMISFQFARLLGDAANGKIVGAAIFKLVALHTVNLFVLLTPFAFFIAVLIGLSKFAAENELIAMRAIGFSPGQIYSTIFYMAVPLAFLTLYLTLDLLPKTRELRDSLQQKARKESELSLIQPGQFRTIGNQMTIYVASVGENQFSRFFVWQVEDGAESATVAKNGQQINDKEDRYIELGQGARLTEDSDGTQLMQFERLLALLPAVSAVPERQRVKSVPTADLINQSNLAFQLEFQRRVSISISVLLLALFAPMLVQINPRENRYGKYVTAILVYAIYLNSQYIFQAMVEKGNLPLYPGMYTSHLVFIIFLGAWWLISTSATSPKPKSNSKSNPPSTHVKIS